MISNSVSGNGGTFSGGSLVKEYISNIKTVPWVVFSDIDNTLYDFQSRMKSIDPEYDIESVSYGTVGEKYDFKYITSRPDFYTADYFNLRVLDVFHTLPPSTRVVFYSKCLSDEAYENKLGFLKAHFGNNVTFVREGDDPKEFLSRLVYDYAPECKKEEVLFIDDSPQRLKHLIELGYPYAKVAHPYNEALPEGIGTLRPNYLIK